MSVLQSIVGNTFTATSATLSIGLDCINSTSSAEDAIRRFPNHAAEIALAAMALLLSDDSQDAPQNEIFEYVSNLISVHDELY